ncbi:MAG TPA: DUF2911 domain-containing protein [Acidobacteriota bacterium]|nr:DUF2911 domain-containing protein [Acidobacteriota bacterium]
MKTRILIPCLFAAAATGLLLAQQGRAPLSPPAETSVTINGKTISIKYSAPSMRGRKIFGELVPYGKVWRAGANAATALHTDADLDLGGLTVPKGDYTLYVWPEANKWTLIVNKETGQWGTRYNQQLDLGRVEMNMSQAPAPIETFKITLSETGSNSAKLEMAWENTVASVPIAVN